MRDGENAKAGKTEESPESEVPSSFDGLTSVTEREKPGIPPMTLRLLVLCVIVLGALWFMRSR